MSRPLTNRIEPRLLKRKLTAFKRTLLRLRVGDPQTESDPKRAALLRHAWNLLSDPDVDPNGRTSTLSIEIEKWSANLLAGGSIARFLKGCQHAANEALVNTMMHQLQELAPSSHPGLMPKPARRMQLSVVLEVSLADGANPDLFAFRQAVRDVLEGPIGAQLAKVVREHHAVSDLVIDDSTAVSIYLPHPALEIKPQLPALAPTGASLEPKPQTAPAPEGAGDVVHGVDNG